MVKLVSERSEKCVEMNCKVRSSAKVRVKGVERPVKRLELDFLQFNKLKICIIRSVLKIRVLLK